MAMATPTPWLPRMKMIWWSTWKAPQTHLNILPMEIQSKNLKVTLKIIANMIIPRKSLLCSVLLVSKEISKTTAFLLTQEKPLCRSTFLIWISTMCILRQTQKKSSQRSSMHFGPSSLKTSTSFKRMERRSDSLRKLMLNCMALFGFSSPWLWSYALLATCRKQSKWSLVPTQLTML